MKLLCQIFDHITSPFDVQEEIWFRSILRTDFTISVDSCTDVYRAAGACNCTLDRVN
jgi:hypothetical protein